MVERLRSRLVFLFFNRGVDLPAGAIEMVLLNLCVPWMGEVAVDRPYSAAPTGIGKWWRQVKSLF